MRARRAHLPFDSLWSGARVPQINVDALTTHSVKSFPFSRQSRMLLSRSLDSPPACTCTVAAPPCSRRRTAVAPGAVECVQVQSTPNDSQEAFVVRAMHFVQGFGNEHTGSAWPRIGAWANPAMGSELPFPDTEGIQSIPRSPPVKRGSRNGE